jgi:two-component system NarL family response regulator
VYVLASTETTTLDGWRPALGDEPSLVEVRRLDGLVDCLHRLTPQLLLLDARLIGSAGARGVTQLAKASPETRMVVLINDCGEDLELDLFRAGARGVCGLHPTVETLAKVVDSVLRGEIWIRRGLMPKLLDSLLAERGDQTSGTTGRFAILTPREIEITRLIGQGASNKRIARHLAITEQTVKGHLTAIFRKTGVVDRVKLALLVARRH